jgi:hypothetical protein
MEMIMEFAGTARPPRMMRLRHRYRTRTDTVEFGIALVPAGSARPRRAVSLLGGSMASPAT